MLSVRPSPGKGRGVFAERRFAQGELIERAPVLVLPPADQAHVAQTRLDDYCYAWGESRELLALALGYGSLYNHAFAPNALYQRQPELDALDFIALRDIEPGEEITINYNGRPDDPTPLWFSEATG
jgi:SET domain-containing protein